MAPRIRKKTVAFFEVTTLSGKPLPAVEDWQQILRDMEGSPPSALVHRIRGADHYGNIFGWEGNAHLVLARKRDDAPPSLDLTTGEIIDASTQANRPWVEVSIIHFLPNSNRLGYVLGSQAAPRIGSLAAWLNEAVFEDAIDIRPVVSAKLVKRMQKVSAEARLVRLRLGPDQLAAIDQSAGLYSAAQAIGRDFGGGVQVEVIIRIEGRADRSDIDTRKRIAEAGRQLLGRDLEQALVELVDLDDRGHAESEMVDLISHRLARKEKVAVTDDEGKAIRIPSAITAIYRAADNLRTELS
jgi:hypothetical protein